MFEFECSFASVCTTSAC